jgi:hypothetical protein
LAMISRDWTFLPDRSGQLVYGVRLILFWVSTYRTVSSPYYYVKRYRYRSDELKERDP